MFLRAAGWITVLTSHNGYLTHYFNEGQTKALCGFVLAVQIPTSKMPDKGINVCKRCRKYPKNQVYTRNSK